jgi:hypothetical protein
MGMTAIIFVVVWFVMMTITAGILYVWEAHNDNGQRYGGYSWADKFIGFHIAAGLIWPIALPMMLIGTIITFVGKRYFR